MDILKIAAIGIISAIAAVTVKNWRPELAAVVSIAGGLILLFYISGAFGDILSQFDTVLDSCKIAPEYIGLVVRLTGIAYITKFACELCRDCGENAIAVKLELAGKTAVMILTVPVIISFLSMVIETLNTI